MPAEVDDGTADASPVADRAPAAEPPVSAPTSSAAPEPAATELALALEGAASTPDLAREFLDLLTGGPRHLTASAIVTDAPGEHVALVWHLKGRFWVQPGGHLEDGETSLEQAARREVAEEIGLSGLERIGEGPAMLHRHGLDAAFGRCQEHWDVQYLLRAPRPAAQMPLRASEESGDVQWFPWPSRARRPGTAAKLLPEGVVPDLPAALDALAERFATLLR